MEKQHPSTNNPYMPYLPRVIRAKYAPAYLGMSRDVFNTEVKPFITSVPIGRQGIGYDRLDLESWWEHHKQSNGCPAKAFMGGPLCQNVNIEEPEFTGVKNEISGLSTKSGKASAFTASLTRITQMTQKPS